MRALRHHAARTRALSNRRSASLTAERAGGLLRAWLQALLSALRSGTRARGLLLRRWLRHTSLRRSARSAIKHAALAGNRRPRRLSASEGWFAFGTR